MFTTARRPPGGNGGGVNVLHHAVFAGGGGGRGGAAARPLTVCNVPTFPHPIVWWLNWSIFEVESGATAVTLREPAHTRLVPGPDCLLISHQALGSGGGGGGGGVRAGPGPRGVLRGGCRSRGIAGGIHAARGGARRGRDEGQISPATLFKAV